jgi:hypothetical protein
LVPRQPEIFVRERSGTGIQALWLMGQPTNPTQGKIMQTAEIGARPSFARAAVGFLGSTTLLSVAMVFFGSL